MSVIAIRKVICSIWVLTWSMSVHATLIEFDFQNINKLNTNQMQFDVDGITLTVTAYIPNGDSSNVHRNADGLGVNAGDQKRINIGEYLVFLFDGPDGANFSNISFMFPTNANWPGNAFEPDEVLYSELLSMSESFDNLTNGEISSITLAKVIGNGDEIIIRADTGNGLRVAGLSAIVSVPEPSSTILVFGLFGLMIRRYLY